MRTKRVNLVECVRLALEAENISHVKVVEAINAVLGQAEHESARGKLADGRLTKEFYKVTETVSDTWKLPRCVVTMFDTWHGAIARAEKIAPMQSAVGIPPVFQTWLEKFKVQPDVKPETKPEAKETAKKPVPA